jgi:pimeloyl-ACP methyl ester carboxylesterase
LCWRFSRVLRLAGRPFILLEVRHVSLRLCMRTLGVDDVARAVAEVLRRHDIASANWVGHSFGTFVIAHMRKIYPEAVSSVLLCDPVRCLPPCQCRTLHVLRLSACARLPTSGARMPKHIQSSNNGCAVAL